jgi:hypothetical protein
MPLLTVRCSDADLRKWKVAAGSEPLSVVVRRLLDREAVTAGRSSPAVDEAVERASRRPLVATLSVQAGTDAQVRALWVRLVHGPEPCPDTGHVDRT